MSCRCAPQGAGLKRNREAASSPGPEPLPMFADTLQVGPDLSGPAIRTLTCLDPHGAGRQGQPSTGKDA